MSLGQSFNCFVSSRYGTGEFIPNDDAPEEQVFSASLASTRGLLPHLNATFNDGAMSVVAGYLDTMTPNAFAGRDGARHYIGMHQALLVTIVDLALFAFTQATFMPTIGDASVETSPAPSFGSVPGLFLLDRTLAGAGIDADTDRHRVPNDAKRHESAIYFALLMARFVWLHEWAHIHLGHLDLLGEASETVSLVEVPLVGLAPVLSIIDQATRHRIEFEADQAALRLCLAVSSAGWENVPGLAAFDDETQRELILTGAYLITWLFDAYGRHAASLLATHPLPADRRVALQKAAQTIDAGPEFTAITTRAGFNFSRLVNRMAVTPTT